MNAVGDRKLIVKYIDDYYKLLLIVPIVIFLFIFAGYPKYNLIPQYIYTEAYRMFSIIFGFILFGVSLVNLKHRIVTVFNKKFINKSAFWGILGPLHVIFNKQLLIEGTVIRYRGMSAKVISYLSLIGGLLLMFLGFKY